MQFQQNQKVNINGGNITITGAVTISSITNPVVVANDVVVVIPTTFFGALPVTSNNPTVPTQTVTGMKMIMNSTAGTILKVSISNQTTLDAFSCVVVCLTANNFDTIIPLAADVGDGITVSITKVSGTATTVTWQLLGLSQSPVTSTPPGQPISDYPLGGLSQVSASAAGVTLPLLGAPPAGMAYRLHRATWIFGATGVTGEIRGHTSGFFYALCQPAAGFTNPDTMNGQLCTEALDLFGIGAAAAQVFLSYDTVSLPLIQ